MRLNNTAVMTATAKIWKLQLKYFSYQRDQRRLFSWTLICISKIHYFVRKNSQMQALIGLKKHISAYFIHCLKLAGISLASIHQLLKNANPCVCSIALVSKIICMILKIDQDLLQFIGFRELKPISTCFCVLLSNATCLL